MMETYNTYETPPQVDLGLGARKLGIKRQSSWGEQPVAEFTRFIGPGNAVRIRIWKMQASQYGEISAQFIRF